MNRRSKLIAKKMLILSLPVMAAFAVVLILAGRILYSQGEALLGQSEMRQSEVDAALINNHLEKAVADLRFMASSHAMAAWLSDPAPHNFHMLRQDLLQLIREKNVYLQARLLEADGMELVRAEATSSGDARLIPDTNLQRKADRPYFINAMSLSQDEVFISQLDLNVEKGQIEEPFRPTIRISMPLFAANGDRAGVLVFNLRGSIILHGLQEMNNQGGDWRFLLANGQGYWLKGPSPEMEWGFQLPGRQVMTFASIYPRAWEKIRSEGSGRIYTKHGLFIFTSLYPEMTVLKKGKLSAHPDQTKIKLHENRWILAAFLQQSKVSSYLMSLVLPLFIAFGVGSFIILVYAFILTQVHTRLEQSRLKEANQSMALSESLMNLQDLIEANDRNLKQLRDANTQLESVLKAANRVSIIATDNEGTITMFNSGAENLLGYQAEEMVGVSTPERIHTREEMMQRSQELTAELGHPVTGFDIFVESARRGGFDSREWTYVRKDGSLLNVELVVTAISNEDDGVTGFLGIGVDVTERNAALRDLEYNRSRLKSIVETAVDGIFTINTTGYILSVNTSGAAIFGYTPEELVGQKVNMLMEEPHRTVHDKYLQRHLASHTPMSAGLGGREVPGRHRDGYMIPLEIAVSEVRTEMEHFFTGILRDVTLRKQAEETIQKANEVLTEKQRILDDDMIAAAHIQSSLLPQQAPNARGFTMDWLFQPSTHVGGDVFNILPLPGGQMGLYLIDVSGHGPAAAMVTVSISQVLQPGSDFVQENGIALAPDEVLRRVDQAFPIERFDRFSTMFYLVFDPETQSLQSSGAGHPSPLLARPGQPIVELDAGGTVIGMGEPVPFVSERTAIQAGDILLLYTDGCTEHTNLAGEQFGTDRLAKALIDHIHLEPDMLLEELQNELFHFGEGTKPEDDISLVCIKFTDD